ncbi:MAG: primase [Candidatus Woesearchaeota archaeon]|nr:primase [Candidatus Woesearchaeota archaeon]
MIKIFNKSEVKNMGKISIASAKYIIHADINVDGIVDKPDVIGAVFGQTEGLLGADLELRELQRSGRIGRIEVDLTTKNGKTSGTITIPSSLDKAETCIIGAALEIIQRIGPCNANIKVREIEDVRISKRKYVVERAKSLLKELMDKMLPDSQEIADEVASAVRIMEVKEYGKDRLPAGPNIDDADEIIVVEGRADVVNLVKHGFKNVIAMNGSSVPQTIIDLSKRKTITAFVDGDRGGDLNLKELLSVADIDFVVKAPEGLEVEELTKKEIHKALRGKITAEQYMLDHNINVTLENASSENTKQQKSNSQNAQRNSANANNQNKKRPAKPTLNNVSKEELAKFKEISDELVGTKGACLLNDKLEILAKIPISELQSIIHDLNMDVYAIVVDDVIDKKLVNACEKAKVKYLVGNETKVSNSSTPIRILTYDEL